ncbi:hypothetical protein HK098_001204 [Nowakowskiella sp. JEL0407]|nr:hypothetical protein HK098_001204 [Nowakowskiella sp. JEL0407]
MDNLAHFQADYGHIISDLNVESVGSYIEIVSSFLPLSANHPLNDWFLYYALPDFLLNIHDIDLLEEDWDFAFANANRLLCLTVEEFLNKLPAVPPPNILQLTKGKNMLFAVVRAILCDPNSSFYFKSSAVEEYMDEDGQLNPNYVENVHFFIRHEGVVKMFTFLRDSVLTLAAFYKHNSTSPPPVTLAKIVEYISLFFKCLSPTVAVSEEMTHAEHAAAVCYLLRLLRFLISQIPPQDFKREEVRSFQKLLRMVFEMIPADTGFYFTDSDEATDLNTIEEYAPDLEEVNQQVSHDWFELIRLKMCLAEKCFFSTSLDKRIFGINEIKQVISRVTFRNEELEAGPYGNGERTVLRWIKKCEFFKVVFGSLVHIEIVQRCGELLSFLIKCREFGSNYLDIMWNPILTNQHRSIVHAIYTLLLSILPQFPPSLYSYLSDLLCNLPIQALDVSALNVLYTLFHCMVYRARFMSHGSSSSHAAVNENQEMMISEPPLPIAEPSIDTKSPTVENTTASTLEKSAPKQTLREKSFSILVYAWNLIQTQPQLDAEIKNLLVFNLIINTFVNGPHWEEERLKLVEMALDGIKNHLGVIEALKILESIIRTGGTKGPYFVEIGYNFQQHMHPDNFVSPSTLLNARIEFLNELFVEKKLMDLFFDDFVFWRNSIRGIGVSNQFARRNSNTPQNLKEMIVSTIQFHLESRLYFINYLLQQESLPQASLSPLPPSYSYSAASGSKTPVIQPYHHYQSQMTHEPTPEIKHYVFENFKHLEMLWHELIETPVYEIEREIGYVWFLKMCLGGETLEFKNWGSWWEKLKQAVKDQEFEVNHDEGDAKASDDVDAMDEDTMIDETENGKKMIKLPGVVTLMNDLYMKMFPRIKGSDYVNSGFNLFRVLFFGVNFWDGFLRFEGGERYTITEEIVIGRDLLWSIILGAVNEEVGNEAIELLVKISLNVRPESFQNVAETLIDECANYLTKSAAVISKTEVDMLYEFGDDLKFTRCLSLLKVFIDCYDKEFGTVKIQRHGYLKFETFQINLNVIELKKTFPLIVSDNDTIPTLRSKISAKTGYSTSGFRLIFSGSEISLSDKTLSELKVKKGSLISVVRKFDKEMVSKALDSVKDVGKGATTTTTTLTVVKGGGDGSVKKVNVSAADERKSPMEILNSSKYFDMLFLMLELEEKYSSKIWELVLQLPTSEWMRNTLKNLDAGSSKLWQSWLDTKSSPYRLLYTLQIIAHLLVQDEENNEEYEKLELSKSPSSATLSSSSDTYMSTPPVAIAAGPMNDENNAMQVDGQQLSNVTSPVVQATTPSLQPEQSWKHLFQKSEGIYCLIKLLFSSDNFVEMKSMAEKSSLVLVLKVLSYYNRDEIVVNLSMEELTGAVGKLTSIISAASKNEEPDSKDSEIALSAIKMISKLCKPPHKHVNHSLEENAIAPSAVVYSDSVVSDLLQLYTVICNEDWLRFVLLSSKNATVRKNCAEALLSICIESLESPDLSDHEQHPFNFLFDTLNELLTTTSGYVHTSNEYFDIIEGILNMLTPDLYAAHPVFSRDMNKLFSQVIDLLDSHPVSESSTSEPDFTIAGYLRISKMLLQNFPTLKSDPVLILRLIDIVYNCLFLIPTTELHDPFGVPKCKQDQTRQHAFDLMVEIVEVSGGGVGSNRDNFMRVTDLIMNQLVEAAEDDPGWNYSPKAIQKSSCGYVGLRNLGATCYINSIMQQFYMIPSFRQAIFEAEPPPNDEGNERDVSLLRQLQTMYAYLQESEKKAYDTEKYCASYKDENGNKMNPNVQMDVDEYFNNLFDRLENILEGTEHAKIFKNHFGGKLVQQIKSKDCTHVSEREEGFFAIQCEVKNKRTLEESLQLYVEGEMLDGDNKYHCASCGKHVDAIKRACIKTLPENLIVHLKRFDFDMEALRRIKINDYFQFPEFVNMEPYTHDYIQRKDSGEIDETVTSPGQIFQLVGVLVHTGTADSGHYYSFIRERQNTEAKWLHFNDSNVEIFDPKNIEETCFGGPTGVVQWDDQRNSSRPTMKPYSAYMLFYEKLNPNPAVTIPKVPKELFVDVWDENMRFLKDRNVFDHGYQSMLWSVVQSVDFSIANVTNLPEISQDPSIFQAIKIGTMYFLNVLTKSKERSSLKDWINYLKILYTARLDACVWFFDHLTHNMTLLEDIFFSCYVDEVREAFAALIEYILITIRNFSPAEYGLPPTDKEFDAEEGWDKHTRIGVFIELLTKMIRDAGRYWRVFEHFFYLVYRIADFGVVEKHWFKSFSAMQDMIDLYLGEKSPRPSKERVRMGDKFTTPKFKYLLDAVCSILLSCNVTENMDPNQLDTVSGPLNLSDADFVLLFVNINQSMTCPFFAKQVREQQSPDSTVSMIAHCCRNSVERSKAFTNLIIREFSHLSLESSVICANSLLKMLEIDDDFTMDRMEYILTVMVEQLSIENESAYIIAYHFLQTCFTLSANERFTTGVRKLLYRNLETWTEYVLLLTPIENTRSLGEALLTTIILKPAENNEQMMTNLYNLWSQWLPKAYDIFRKRLTSQSEKFGVKYGIVQPLTQYLRVFNATTFSVNDHRNFVGYFKDLLRIFELLKHRADPHDPQMKEIIKHLHHVTKNSDENTEIILENERLVGYLLEFLITLSHNEETRRFNEEMLIAYYGLLRTLCRHSEEFAFQWSSANCFKWALDSILWGEYRMSTKILNLLVDLVELCSNSFAFRNLAWTSFLKKSKHLEDLPAIHLRYTSVLIRKAFGPEEIRMILGQNVPCCLISDITSNISTELKTLALESLKVLLVKSKKTKGVPLESYWSSMISMDSFSKFVEGVLEKISFGAEESILVLCVEFLLYLFKCVEDGLGSRLISGKLCELIVKQTELWISNPKFLAREDAEQNETKRLALEDISAVVSEHVHYLHPSNINIADLDDDTFEIYKKYYRFIRCCCVSAFQHNADQNALKLAFLSTFECLSLKLSDVPEIFIKLCMDRKTDVKKFLLEYEHTMTLVKHLYTTFADENDETVRELWIALYPMVKSRINAAELSKLADCNFKHCQYWIGLGLNMFENSTIAQFGGQVVRALETILLVRETLKPHYKMTDKQKEFLQVSILKLEQFTSKNTEKLDLETEKAENDVKKICRRLMISCKNLMED